MKSSRAGAGKTKAQGAANVVPTEPPAHRRRAGVLLHPSSLPGPYGIGEIGPSARTFLRWLDAAGCSIWQVLPLGPTDTSGSPYASASAVARNPLLLSIDDLVVDGWLTDDERPYWPGSPHRVDFPAAMRRRTPALDAAAERVAKGVKLDAWADARPWVRPWALFAALADVHGEQWTSWPAELRDRDEKAISAAIDQHQAAIQRKIASQWLFDQQWGRLRTEAKARGISLWGDVPFFVSGEGCETWASRGLFRLGDDGRSAVISGVPPDAFSIDGQLWGHPLYDEAAMAAEGYAWWGDRVAAVLELVDLVRLDHFRGVAAYWEVPQGALATAGKWIPGPGQPLLTALSARFGRLPFVAEDLGVITPDVEALRDNNALPGMAVLQFGFGDPDHSDHPHLPHNHRHHQVVYPGTHDNDTVIGWYASVDERTRDHVRRYFLTSGQDIAWDLIHGALRSVADACVVPMQDILALDGHARMNVPGRARGNWAWRMVDEAMNLALAQRLRDQVRISGRLRPGNRR